MSVRKNQVFIGFKCDGEFRALVERAAGGDLSRFVRKALVEKLRALHIHVDPALAEPPSRLGKGGPRKKLTVLHLSDLRAAETPEPSTIPLPVSKPVRYSAKTKPKKAKL
jgi:hypothetical protein